MNSRKVHLVTYATPRFRHRQIILGASGRSYGVVNTVTSWTTQSIKRAGFEKEMKGISLEERGSGFWSWKPFIIQKKIEEIPDGEFVFYCDVGRRFPYKILNRSLDPFVNWMEANSQDFFPGLSISWRGPLSTWTKRDAFVFSGMDGPDVHAAASIQASFSLWRVSTASRSLVSEWLAMSSERSLISDDPSTSGMPELPGFHEHRHDQSLLTLCCIKNGVSALEVNEQASSIDTRDPSQVLEFVYKTPQSKATLLWPFFSVAIKSLQMLERGLRKYLKFGQDMPSHPLAFD